MVLNPDSFRQKFSDSGRIPCSIIDSCYSIIDIMLFFCIKNIHFCLKCDKVLIHPDFDGVYNDLAIIQIANPLQFDAQHISPICMPKDDADLVKPDGKAVVAGWGSVSDPFCSTDGQGEFSRLSFESFLNLCKIIIHPD